MLTLLCKVMLLRVPTTGVRPVLCCVMLAVNYVERFLLSLLDSSADYQRSDVLSMKLKYILNFVDFRGF